MKQLLGETSCGPGWVSRRAGGRYVGTWAATPHALCKISAWSPFASWTPFSDAMGARHDRPLGAPLVGLDQGAVEEAEVAQPPSWWMASSTARIPCQHASARHAAWQRTGEMRGVS